MGSPRMVEYPQVQRQDQAPEEAPPVEQGGSLGGAPAGLEAPRELVSCTCKVLAFEWLPATLPG